MNEIQICHIATKSIYLFRREKRAAYERVNMVVDFNSDKSNGELRDKLYLFE